MGVLLNIEFRIFILKESTNGILYPRW
jgi:hypothetical protein